MIPRPTPQAPTRDDLAKQASWLTMKSWRGTGAKTMDEMSDIVKGMEKEGANPAEIATETEKYSDPNETGLNRNPAGQLGFELSDKDMRLTPEALSMLKSSMGGYGGDTGEMNLDRLLRHDTLFNRVPELRQVKTSLSQPFSGDDALPGGGYSSPASKAGRGTSAGRIEVFGKPDLPPDSIDENSVLGLLAHEVQHPTQFLQNQPAGGYPDDLKMQTFFKDQMQPRARKIREETETRREQYARDYAQREGGGPSLEALEAGRAQWKATYPQLAVLLDQAEYLSGKPGNSKLGILTTPGLKPLGQYQSLAGEQAAERTADRLDWGTEQRRDNPMFETSGRRQLAPAFQMLRYPGQAKLFGGGPTFALPDLRQSLANTVVRG